MPTQHEWLTFTHWGKQYGDIVYVNVHGKSMIFINSRDVAFELFEKRSSIYSDRFEFTMANNLMGFNWNFGLMPYGEWWRRHRKAFHQEFNAKIVTKYRGLQERETHAILSKILETPDDFAGLIRDLTAIVIMEITYGLRVVRGDPYLVTISQSAAALAEAGVPGAYLVDTITMLKYLPEWIGTRFQQRGREVRLINKELVDGPYKAAKAKINAGTSNMSILKSMLEKLENQSNSRPDEETVIRNTAAVTYFTGADTTVFAIEIFILAMLLHPESQRKAQAELDEVIGKDRLPLFDDKDNLPFINALCQEVLRWYPVVPMGVAHRVMKDDVFNGYFIPEGSTVIGNSWAILHDERTYANPEAFIPERFLGGSKKYPLESFGFGRRICPGRHLANDSLFIAAASILCVFDITPAKDDEGADIIVKPEFTSGLLSHPLPFKCSIKPRSAVARELILSNAGGE